MTTTTTTTPEEAALERSLDRADTASSVQAIQSERSDRVTEAVKTYRANVLADAVRYTTDDPEDQWEGAAAPFDMPFVPPARSHERVCRRCFIVHSTAALDANDICIDCTGGDFQS